MTLGEDDQEELDVMEEEEEEEERRLNHLLETAWKWWGNQTSWRP